MSRLWDLTAGKPGERALLGPSGRRVQSLAFAPNGKAIAAGSGALDGLVWVFDLTGSAPREAIGLRGARGAVHAVAYSPDGTLVIGGGEDRSLRLWEPGPGSRGDPRAHLPGHTGPIRSVAFAPDGQGAATASDDGTVRLWTISRLRSSERLVIPHPAGVMAVAYSPDGYTLLTGARDGVIRLWDPTASRPFPRGELAGQSSAIRILVVTTDGRTLTSVAEGPKVVHWDLAAGRPTREWSLPSVSPTGLAVTVDGRYMAMGRVDGALEVYRVGEKRV
jgi:WD40 repeat protein